MVAPSVVPVVHPSVVSNVPSKASKRARSNDEPSDNIEWDILPTAIEKGDIVVLLCAKEDKASFNLPNIIEKKIWIAKAIKYAPSSSNFTGIFMYNNTRDPKDPWMIRKKPDRLGINTTATKDEFKKREFKSKEGQKRPDTKKETNRQTKKVNK
jgi:hypothetical protein